MSNNTHDFGTGNTQEGTNRSQLPAAPQFEAYYKEVGQSRPKRPKSNPLIPMFAAFLTGALVIGGVAYTADRGNLFTGGVKEERAASGSLANGVAGKDAGLTTASLSTSEDIATIYEEASPAVVKIENYKEPQQPTMMGDEWLRHFMGGQGAESGRNGNEGQQSATGELALKGAGTGFFLTKKDTF